jgi:signal transduction histidine kinase
VTGVSRRSQLSLFVAATAPVACIEALFFVWGRGPQLHSLPWVELSAQSFAMLAALAIAFFCFGRYRALDEPSTLWVGLAFWAYALFGAMHLATFPGALDEASLLPVHPHVWGWPYLLRWLAFASLLICAVVARRPQRPGRGRTTLRLFAAVTVACLAAGALVAVLGEALPAQLTNGRFNGTGLRYATVLVSLTAVGALVAAGGAGPERPVVRAAGIVQAVATLCMLGDLTGGRLYDAAWYMDRALLTASFSLMLLSLLSGYVSLLREQTELAQRAHASATTLRATFEGMTDGVFVLDARGQVTEANSRGALLLGFTSAAQALRPAADYPRLLDERSVAGRPLAPNDSPEVRALRGETVHSQFGRGVTLDGRELYVETSAAPLRDQAGTITGAVVVLRDVGALESARAQATVAKVATAVSVARGLPALVEAVLSQVAGSLQAAGLALYTADDACRTLRLCGHRGLPAETVERLRELSYDATSIGPRAVVTGELQVVRDVRAIPEALSFLSGVARDFGEGSLVAVPLKAYGRTVGAMTYATQVPQDYSTSELETIQTMGDIVAVGLANAQLEDDAEKERRRLEAVIAASPEGILLVGFPEGQLLLANTAAREILGPAIALTSGSFCRPDGRPFARDELPPLRAIRGEVVIGEELLVITSEDSKVPILVNAAPIRGPDGSVAGAVALFQNISPLKALERQREDFIHTVSHDLRTPLSIVLGHAQIIERFGDASERVAKGTRAIITAVRRMNSMIQDLVDSSRLESGDLRLAPRPIDLRAYLTDLRERLSVSLDTQRVRLEVPDGLPEALADVDRLERIVTNLVSNALKYSPGGTQVRVTVAARDGELVTSVEDHGRGIAPDELPKLFQRYFRTRDAREHREGLGLGLYIVKGLVEAHHGRVWVESAVDRGSAFHFSLPIAVRVHVEPRPSATAPPSPGTSRGAPPGR